MRLLYQAGIFVYSFFAKTATLYNSKARQFVRGRKNWQKSLAAKIETNARYVWFHCASLGEFEQGRPLMEEIKSRFPEYRIVLTFFSPSGFEIRKNYNHADIILYLPLDTKKNAKSFLRMVQPEIAFFIKYEYWYFFINELKKREIPLYIVSAIFRKDQYFFKDNLLGKWYRNMLHKTTHLFLQDKNSAELLHSININNYTISGDTRFDRVATIAQNAREIPIVEKFKNSKILLVAGSTWKPDEELLADYANKNPEIKMIIAPHEVDHDIINRLETMFMHSIRFSKLTEEEAGNYHVLIVDSIGMLSSIYKYGHFAYIGGGFGAGIHNILEAATFGLPVVFGPNHQKFKEALDLINTGGAYPVEDAGNLDRILSALVNNSSKRRLASEICKNYVAQNTGATHHILKKVFNI